MLNQFSRTELIYGRDAMEMLKDARVAVFGIGGVGGYTVEALARSGVGSLDLIDDDKVCLTNINRQIYATRKTVGQYKVDVAAERIKDINPDAVVRTYKTFYTPETADQFDFKHYDYIVDAIDTVTGKIALVMNAKAAKTPIICSMGAGNKVDPTAFEVTDLYKTSVCPLAKALSGEDITIYGQGTRKQTYIHVKDIAQAIYRCIVSQAQGVYNLASYNLISNLDLAKKCISLLHSTSQIVYDGNTDPMEGLCWDVSIEKLKRDTNFEPEVTIDEAIFDLANGI